MMILILIFSISTLQFLLYYLNYRKIKKEFLSTIILFGILACYYFILPKMFYPEPRTDGINCGLPILGLTFAFWIFGSIAALITHIIWVIWKFKTK